MRFELLPVLDIMIDLYQQPRSTERFQNYLKKLQGTSHGNLVMPLVGFNPMAKEHVLEKLFELKELEVESIMKKVIQNLNTDVIPRNHPYVYKVSFNLADDLKGGWTNRYTTDYDSKFRFHGIFNKYFCTPYFWSGETFSVKQIEERTAAYLYRTIYWVSHSRPLTLRQHLEQEIFVSKNSKNFIISDDQNSADEIKSFFEENQNTEDFPIIFNFFYGDEASLSLSFPTFGLTGMPNGFEYAHFLANEEVQKN